jgi:hypothetical protein
MPEGVSNSAVGLEMEVDGEDMSFALYKEITIQSSISESSKEIIVKDIESNLINSLNACLTASGLSIESIKVTIDATGKISNIAIQGLQISDELKKCITECIGKWNFNVYKVNNAWSFEIKF